MLLKLKSVYLDSLNLYVSIHFIVYAHIEIVVAFLVVNFFGFLVITRDHGSFEGRH